MKPGKLLRSILAMYRMPPDMEGSEDLAAIGTSQVECSQRSQLKDARNTSTSLNSSLVKDFVPTTKLRSVFGFAAKVA